MLESDADRLASIKALGGLCVPVRSNELWGIFEDESVDAFEMAESRGPTLMCRSSDVAAFAITKEEVLLIRGIQYRVKKPYHDGTGYTTLELKL